MHHQRVDLGQLQEAIADANRHFLLLRRKHPNLRAYLVLSLPGGQTGIDSAIEKMIDEFPTLMVAGKAKVQMLSFLKPPPPEKPTEAQKEQWSVRFQELANDLEFDGESQVEVRFHHLDYELIGKLQTDDLVDRVLTPQTRASIRIVLGTISHFSERPPKFRTDSVQGHRMA